MHEIKFRVWDNIAKKYIDGRHVSIDGFGLLHVAKHIIKNCFRPPHTSLQKTGKQVFTSALLLAKLANIWV